MIATDKTEGFNANNELIKNNSTSLVLDTEDITRETRPNEEKLENVTDKTSQLDSDSKEVESTLNVPIEDSI